MHIPHGVSRGSKTGKILSLPTYTMYWGRPILVLCVHEQPKSEWDEDVQGIRRGNRLQESKRERNLYYIARKRNAVRSIRGRISLPTLYMYTYDRVAASAAIYTRYFNHPQPRSRGYSHRLQPCAFSSTRNDTLYRTYCNLII